YQTSAVFSQEELPDYVLTAKIAEIAVLERIKKDGKNAQFLFFQNFDEPTFDVHISRHPVGPGKKNCHQRTVAQGINVQILPGSCKRSAPLRMVDAFPCGFFRRAERKVHGEQGGCKELQHLPEIFRTVEEKIAVNRSDDLRAYIGNFPVGRFRSDRHNRDSPSKSSDLILHFIPERFRRAIEHYQIGCFHFLSDIFNNSGVQVELLVRICLQVEYGRYFGGIPQDRDETGPHNGEEFHALSFNQEFLRSRSEFRTDNPAAVFADELDFQSIY